MHHKAVQSMLLLYTTQYVIELGSISLNYISIHIIHHKVLQSTLFLCPNQILKFQQLCYRVGLHILLKELYIYVNLKSN